MKDKHARKRIDVLEEKLLEITNTLVWNQSVDTPERQRIISQLTEYFRIEDSKRERKSERNETN